MRKCVCSCGAGLPSVRDWGWREERQVQKAAGAVAALPGRPSQASSGSLQGPRARRWRPRHWESERGAEEGVEGGEEQRRGASSLALPSPGMPPGQRREAGGKATVPCPSGPPSHSAQVKVCSGKLRDPSPHRGRGQGPGRLPPHGKGRDTGPGTARPTGEGSQQTPTGTLSSQDL